MYSEEAVLILWANTYSLSAHRYVFFLFFISFFSLNEDFSISLPKIGTTFSFRKLVQNSSCKSRSTRWQFNLKFVQISWFFFSSCTRKAWCIKINICVSAEKTSTVIHVRLKLLCKQLKSGLFKDRRRKEEIKDCRFYWSKSAFSASCLDCGHCEVITFAISDCVFVFLC